MFHFIMAEDCELWDVGCEVPYGPTTKVKYGDFTRIVL